MATHDSTSDDNKILDHLDDYLDDVREYGGERAVLVLLVTMNTALLAQKESARAKNMTPNPEWEPLKRWINNQYDRLYRRAHDHPDGDKTTLAIARAMGVFGAQMGHIAPGGKWSTEE